MHNNVKNEKNKKMSDPKSRSKISFKDFWGGVLGIGQCLNDIFQLKGSLREGRRQISFKPLGIS